VLHFWPLTASSILTTLNKYYLAIAGFFNPQNPSNPKGLIEASNPHQLLISSEFPSSFSDVWEYPDPSREEPL
jgi:hypothetical protein